MIRIGVFVCWCGSNIAGTVDVGKVAEESAKMPGVVHVEQNKYTCSDPGQDSIRKAIKEHRLDRVVVAACSPRMHEMTFRKCAASAGLNQYLVEMANIREHCSWVHSDMSVATPKAVDIVRRAVAKVKRSVPLFPSTIPVEKRALVIGGGIAGIQAALDIAEAGYEVTIVEREPTIGGRMAQLDKTFPTLDCSSCILTPKMVDAASHPGIRILTCSEVEDISGYVGNFQVRLRKRARSIDEARCTACGICISKCPTSRDSEFNMGLGTRKAIYMPFPQAVPNKPTIDREICRHFTEGKCGICQKVCPSGAVDFSQEDQVLNEKFGAVVAATGATQFSVEAYGEYGYGRYPDVITGLELERLISSTGPTDGKIRRPSDGRIPRTVVFIKCVGSRDENKGYPYCSKACCMYTAKHAILLKEKIPGASAYVFYMDVRAGGKDYEEFYQRSQEIGTRYVRGRVSRIYPLDGKLIVQGEDTLLGQRVEVEADLVVLAAAMVPQIDAPEMARKLGISYNQYGFFSEAHPKLRPVETNTAGVFLAGTCQGPKDIPETVAQASAAAVKVISLFAKSELTTNPNVASVDESLCSGCLWCVNVCPYKAIEEKIITERAGKETVTRSVASVNTGLCQGCGACTVACRDGAMNLLGFTNEQILAEVEALCL